MVHICGCTRCLQYKLNIQSQWSHTHTHTHTHLRLRGEFCLNSSIKLTNFSNFYDNVSDSDYILSDGTMTSEF